MAVLPLLLLDIIFPSAWFEAEHVLYKLGHKLQLPSLLSQFYTWKGFVMVQPSDFSWDF